MQLLSHRCQDESMHQLVKRSLAFFAIVWKRYAQGELCL